MRLLRQMAGALTMSAAVALVSSSLAQDTSPAAQQAAPANAALTQEQLDQLVAPIALYDDPLLADILVASTYPLEVVEAHRWVSVPANAALRGDDLTSALADQSWDPSIKALVPFPKILGMMDNHLEWTESLGEAFLAQQGDLMDAVQRLRHSAESAGTLKSSPQETVSNDGDDVMIAPPPSDVIYVPDYDPWCAYGPWPYPMNTTYFYSPWPGDCGPADYMFAWDTGIYLPFGYWEWGRLDWRNHRIGIDRGHFDQYGSGHASSDDVWRHDPEHRVGVPYRDPRNVQQFQPEQDRGASYRGYENRDGGEPPQSTRPAPPVFENYGPGPETRTYSERGQMSRGGMSGGEARGGGFGGGERGGGSGGGSSGRRH